ncbi:MAG: MaoC family dehydratase [Inquilinus sp.]|nr:MaoC family dehydratase [Inquilinus sp.]
MGDVSDARNLEDFTVGDRFETGTVAVTEQSIVAFASDHDPQIFHLDEAAAKDSFFGRLVASGWQTAGLTMRLMVDARFLGDTPLVGLGVESLAWPRPVLPGDVLTATVEILEVRPSRSNPARGAMRTKVTTVNKAGETVYQMTSTILMPRRGAQR